MSTRRLRPPPPEATPHRRWLWAGTAIGALAALVASAPAAWLAGGVTHLSGQRLLLAEAEGSIWNGSAIVVASGGAGSQATRALPGRLAWTLRPRGMALQLSLTHACCLAKGALVTLKPGWNAVNVDVQAPGTPPLADGLTPLGQWPASWLVGFGTPWNTVQPSGAVRLAASDLQLHWVQGRFRMDGQARLDLQDFGSRLVTLPRLGSYRLTATGNGEGPMQLRLSTLDGALRLQAEGTLGVGGLRLRGEASAASTEQGALDNLLNIIGRRQGARSIISIG